MDLSGEKLLQRRLSRRGFLKATGEAALGVGAVVLFGCTTNKKPETPTPKMPEVKIPQGEQNLGKLPELTELQVKDIARIATADFNKVLGFQLSDDEIVEKTNLVPTLEKFQEIVAVSEESYVPKNEIDRAAITSDSRSIHGREIFLNKLSLEQTTSELPNSEQGKSAKFEFVEFIEIHELTHFISSAYRSDQLHDLVYGKMLANIAAFKDKNVQMQFVEGAEVHGLVDGKQVSTFQKLEEAEAFLIGEMVMRKRGKNQTVSWPKAKDVGAEVQADLLKNLLSKLGRGDVDENLKTLAHLRSEEGGREKFCQLIGERFKIPTQDQLFFSMSVLFAIDLGDRQLYQNLTNR